MSDFVATRSPEVPENSLVNTVIVRFSARVIEVAVIGCLDVISRVLVVVGSGSRTGELVTLVNAGGLDVVRTVCVRIVVDSESVMDLSAVTDNSDTLAVDSLAVDAEKVLVGYSVLAKSGIETDESVRDFKVVEGLMVDTAD